MTDTPPVPEPTPAADAPAYAEPAAPAAPGYAAPGYAAPYAPGYAAPNPTNTLAIVAFALSIAGFFIPGASIAAIITGHLSLGQIKRTGQAGHGFGLAGTIIGWVVTGLGLLGIVIYVLVFVFFIAAASTSGSFSG
jgi:hypothetical protein